MSEITVEFGAEQVAPRASLLRDELVKAASVALLDIDENEKQALEKIRAEANDKRNKIKRAVVDMLNMSDMRLVRKFWHEKQDNLFLHFIGDRTKIGAAGSEKADDRS